jgi:hypothetical protein
MVHARRVIVYVNRTGCAWVVERILAWITAHRRGARDHHRVPEGHEAMVARITQHLATPRP